MGELLRQLEKLDAYIDVEMNSLEDAYLEIAKHEEKLIAESTKSQSEREKLLQNHNIQSINETMNADGDAEAGAAMHRLHSRNLEGTE